MVFSLVFKITITLKETRFLDLGLTAGMNVEMIILGRSFRRSLYPF